MNITATNQTTTMNSANLFRREDSPVHFDEGEFLIKQDSSHGRCYVILEGSVTIRHNDRIISNEGPGSIVGELSLVDSKAASADVIATSKTKVATVTPERFEYLVQQHPFFALDVMRVMAYRLRRMTDSK